MKVSVAEFIGRAIDLSGKSQAQICDELGYANRNLITMFKQGKTRVPPEKVKSLAAALNVDPIHLLRLVLTEYRPGTWEVIEQVLGGRFVTAGQQIFDQLCQEEVGHGDVDLRDPMLNAALRQALRDYSKRTTTQ